MSQRPSSWADDFRTKNASLVVPRPALHRTHEREDAVSNDPSHDAEEPFETTPNDPVDLRYTESSDDYFGILTKEKLEAHKQQCRQDTEVAKDQGEQPGGPASLPSRTCSECVQRRILKLKRSLTFFRDRVKSMTWKQLLWVSVLILLVMAGNTMQILMLNFWLDMFEKSGISGNYTAFAVPGILFSLFFIVALALYIVVRRPNMKFAGHFYGWLILIGIGFCDTFNSWLATYAASHTSEVLQALFTNLCPLYAVFMSKWILHDPRTYLNGWIVSVFVLTIVGILVASVYGVVVAGDMGDGKIWILIFFLSIPFRVLQNVWQSLYMIVYTRDPAFSDWLYHRFRRGARNAGGDGESQGATPGGKRLGGVDAVSGLQGVPFQLDGGLAEHIVLDDADREQDEGTARMIVAPHPSACPSEQPEDKDRDPSANASFGRQHRNGENHLAPLAPSRSVSQRTECEHENNAASALPSQLQTVQEEIVSIRYHQGEDMIVKLIMLAGETTVQTCFTLALLPADALPWWGNSSSAKEAWTSFTEGIVCVFTVRDNFIFGFLYTLGFVFTYVGCAYLNHYSVALCSIVSQLSSPLTALLLVLVPSWNVQGDGDESPWYMSVIAIVLLSLAAFIYVVWEEQTDAEKVEGERVLKMKKLRVRPLEDENAMPLENCQGI